MGALSELGHDVSGHVYIVDEYTIRIYNLNYDGTAPGNYLFQPFFYTIRKLGYMLLSHSLVQTLTTTLDGRAQPSVVLLMAEA